MDDLVVRTRTQSAQRNLERVSRLSQSLEGHEGGLAEFLTLPEDLFAMAEAVWNTVYRLRGSQDDLVENRDQLEEGLRELDTAISDLLGRLRRSRAAASRLKADIETLATKKDITTMLTTRARQTQRTLTEENYWQQRGGCEEIFSEYVDLLGGIALRTGRIKGAEGDRPISDLFLIADRLPETWPPIGFSWQSIAVPAPIERNSSTTALVLRIGFPEWTIWALPLLHHEFGHVFAGWKRQLGSTAPGSCSEAVVAEALATLVSGPAYACASLLLRQDPAAVGKDRGQAALRCATVLTTLQHAAGEDAALGALANRLADSWRTAVDEAGGESSAFNDALGSTVCQEAREYAELILAEEGAEPEPPVWARKWATIGTWAQGLKDGANRTDDGSDELGKAASPGTLLSLLMNAAWLARVDLETNDNSNSKQVDTIAETAISRMLEHVRRSGGESRMTNI